MAAGAQGFPERHGRLFVVSGPSGAGKGTMIKEVLRRRPEVVLSVSATTRPARPKERNGVDYHFITPEEFVGMRDRGEFLETAEVYGYLYGTPREAVERLRSTGRDVILELDIQGAVSVKRAIPEAVLVFVEPPSLDDLAARLRGRGTEDPASMGRRITAAYEEVRVRGLYDHIIVNEDVDAAADEFIRILESS